ncbi:MAG TPA: DUF3857 domain-containing protein [Bryobacteraceae bacterium]|nr:DUF3857 domain-containing protein [Bryobacteraceae bacterium]
MGRFSRTFGASLVFSFLVAESMGFSQNNGAAARDYSKEAFVIEKLATDVAFVKEGTGTIEQTLVIRIQSEAAVRELGVLSIPYNADNERLEFAYVRVRKPDGTVVATPESAIQEVSSAVSREAPTYSDLKEKQVPVKSLGAGDVLEYQVRTIRTKPEVPNQFWYQHDFFKAGIALDETLRITVPPNQYVKVVSPGVTPATQEEAGQKVYIWKTSQLEPVNQDDEKKKKPAKDQPVHSVQMTTFRSWDEVGRWYGELQSSRMAVTPAIQSKASELTKGLNTDADKERAIYNFVSSRLRYISISFGVGRFQPHSADEVLANQYGDCKDKHTLLAAMLKAVGIEAWPALIGTETKLDPDVPSPAHFNHVITVVAQGKDRVWLDSTPEVAPFALLSPEIRDKQALVIPSSESATLMTTPADPPFPGVEIVEAKTELTADGTLKGHFDISVRGDGELILRGIFHSAPPAQWQAVAQQISMGMGYAGKVSAVEVENPDNPDKPFHYSYDYARENYSDWTNRRITAPFPPLGLPGTEDDKAPTEPLELGGKEEFIYRGTMRLPAGYSLATPDNVDFQWKYADYTAKYSVKDSVLTAERHLTIKSAKLPVAAWSGYKEFRDGVIEDQTTFMPLRGAGGVLAPAAVSGDPAVISLLQQGMRAVQRREFNAAKDAFAQAERLDPKQQGLWIAWAAYYDGTGNTAKSIESLKKEIELHPDSETAYLPLVEEETKGGSKADAIATLQSLVKVAPGNTRGRLVLLSLLTSEKRYSDAAAVAQAGLDLSPKDERLQFSLIEALLRDGKKDEGSAAARKLGDSPEGAGLLNDIAWVLAETNTDLPLALDDAQRYTEMVEGESKDVKLASVGVEDLRRVDSIDRVWDTLGWVYFRMGETVKAEKYISAAWKLGHDGIVADHLGEIYEKQGKHDDAIHMWTLAAAADKNLDNTKERLAKAGIAPAPNAVEELSKLRTTALPSLPVQQGTAEFYISFSRNRTEEVRFIKGDTSLKGTTTALSRARYDVAFPDEGPERLVLRGILSCSRVTTPGCQIVLLQPSTTAALQN